MRRRAGFTSAARDDVACIEIRFVSARERRADHRGQIDFAIWLGEQQLAAAKMAILDHGVPRITGGAEHLERRPAVQCRDGRPPAVDRAGHHHVGKHKVDFLARIDDCHGLAGVAGVKRPIAETQPLADDISSDQNIVLDDQLHTLPDAELETLGPRLELVELVRETVLVEAGHSLTRVYLPHSGAISIMVCLSEGQTVEVATIGRDSIFGAAARTRSLRWRGLAADSGISGPADRRATQRDFDRGPCAAAGGNDPLQPGLHRYYQRGRSERDGLRMLCGRQIPSSTPPEDFVLRRLHEKSERLVVCVTMRRAKNRCRRMHPYANFSCQLCV